MKAADGFCDAAPVAGRDPSVPPESRNVARAVCRKAFLIRRPLVDAHFTRRSDDLIVTFDNLSSVGQSDPAQPWLALRAERMGLSILGLIAKRKDWYRNPDAAALLTMLREAGLFAQFRRVTFVGASMGGYAALALAALVPGAHVLAFSPQSTLARDLVPFDRRYRYAQRAWDWTSPEHLDAAASVPRVASVTLVYDPFERADKLHAARLDGPNVRHIHTDHMGHRAIRVMKDAGGLDLLIQGIATGTFDALAYAQAARGRRRVLFWQRALLGEAERRGHLRLAAAAARRLSALAPEQRHGHRAAARLQALVSPGAAERITHVTAGDPQAPFTGAILHLHRALVVPERDHDAKLASGVLRADGSYCPLSRAWIRARKPTPAPTLSLDEPVGDLPGRYLFGGHFRGHFGHFLVESTARLWALDHLDGPVDGILYLPYRGQTGPVEAAMRGHQAFFDALGVSQPLKTFGTAMRVDELVLPELGFGWEDRYAGSPAYRRFMMDRLSAAAEPQGGDRLYISRARLPAARGGVLGETVIEENLARLGFDIFHPERHSIRDQIARYRAAKTVVALDGSALHLAAYVLPPQARVAMILRRSRANAADYILQYKSFLGITPSVIDVIRHDWVAGTANRADFRSVGELDFPRLFRCLKDLDLIPRGFRPDLPDRQSLQAMLAQLQDRRGEPFRILGKGEVHPDTQSEAA